MDAKVGRFEVNIDDTRFRPFRDGSGPREFRERINFPDLRHHAKIEVHVAIAAFDVEPGEARLRVVAENTSHEGFDLVISTWADTKIWAVGVTWLAVAAA